MKNLEEARQQWEKLSVRIREVLLGTVLGGTSVGIDKGYVNARVQFRHSIKQTEYFNWKRDILRPEISEDRVAHADNKDTKLEEVKNKAKWRYQSGVRPSLTYLHTLTHVKGVKTVMRSTLNMLTSLSLAVWWLDDGSIVAKGRQGNLSTEGYTEESAKTLEQYLRVEWGIEAKAYLVKENGKPKLKKDGTERWRVRIPLEGLEKLLKLIMPHVEVREMLYKIIIRYKDHEAERQQRWTSEIVARTKFTREQVEEELAKKKSEDDIVHSEIEKEEIEKWKH